MKRKLQRQQILTHAIACIETNGKEDIPKVKKGFTKYITFTITLLGLIMAGSDSPYPWLCPIIGLSMMVIGGGLTIKSIKKEKEYGTLR